ncbi:MULTISPECIES: hypothetical protein [Brachybacterium]|uniref:hypothetical protein n=1 Tax=Brachybacterium TaxID=43668 RepID=UPI003FD4139B
MKVTDTHDTAAEHFDYLDADALSEVERDDAPHDLEGEAHDLIDLVQVTGPAPTVAPRVSARTA